MKRSIGVVTGGVFLAVAFVSQGLAEDVKSASERLLERRQRAELKGFFMKNPDQASLPTTPIAVELYNQAADHYQRQDYDLAREALKESLSYDERNSYAFELLADIDYLEGDLEQAREHYRKAYVLRPSDSVREKLEKIGREEKAEEELQTVVSDKFILKYDAALTEEEVQGIQRLLRETYENLSGEFGYYFRQPVTVFLYSGEDFKKVTELPHWVTGVYDGKIRMPAYPVGIMENEIRAIAAHEMTHAFVAGMSGGEAPPWINEGLAEYEEHKVRPEDPIVFRAAVKTQSLLPIDQLMIEENLGEQGDPLFANLFYAQAFHLVQYIIERYGLLSIKRILTEFSRGMNSNEALWAVLKISPEQLEIEWKNSFTN